MTIACDVPLGLLSEVRHSTHESLSLGRIYGWCTDCIGGGQRFLGAFQVVPLLFQFAKNAGTSESVATRFLSGIAIYRPEAPKSGPPL